MCWSPFMSKPCILFYFRTCITLNQRFPVHLIDPHVTHKTQFYHNFFSSFLSRILKIKFWGSNILESDSNILEPPNVPDCHSLAGKRGQRFQFGKLLHFLFIVHLCPEQTFVVMYSEYFPHKADKALDFL